MFLTLVQRDVFYRMLNTTTNPFSVVNLAQNKGVESKIARGEGGDC